MITEDFVSFETAKLLKEKGFDEYGMYFYTLKDEGREGYKSNKRLGELAHNSNPDLKERAVSCPTLQMAMKWLREKHNIFIAINMIPDTIQKHYFFKPYVGRKIYNFPLDYSVEFYTTYEEAAEAAIKYCLKNLV